MADQGDQTNKVIFGKGVELGTTDNGDAVSVNGQKMDHLKIDWQSDAVLRAANSQAYFDLSLLSNQGANGCQVVLNLPQQDLTTNADLNLVGQFFDLGYYRQAQTITFTTKIYGSHQMTFAKPQVIFLKTHQYQAAAKKMLKQTVPLRISQNQAQGVVKRRQAGWLYTSIPADPGWQVKINGQRIKTRSVAGIFLTLPLKAGTNHIKLTFIPPGFELGVVLTILGLLLFAVGWLKTKWQQKRG